MKKPLNECFNVNILQRNNCFAKAFYVVFVNFFFFFLRYL